MGPEEPLRWELSQLSLYRQPEGRVQHSLSAQFWARSGGHLLEAQRNGKGVVGVTIHAVEQSVKNGMWGDRNMEPGEITSDRERQGQA